MLAAEANHRNYLKTKNTIEKKVKNDNVIHINSVERDMQQVTNIEQQETDSDRPKRVRTEEVEDISTQVNEPSNKKIKRKHMEDLSEDESDKQEDSEGAIQALQLSCSDMFLKLLSNEPVEVKRVHDNLFRKYLKTMQLKSMKKARESFNNLMKHKKFTNAMLAYIWHKARSI